MKKSKVISFKISHPDMGYLNTIVDKPVAVPVGDSYGLFTKETLRKVSDIKIKVEWKTATYTERNFLNIYNKRLKKYQQETFNGVK